MRTGRTRLSALWVLPAVAVYFIVAPMSPRTLAQDAGPFKAELVIRADQPRGTINRNIYGQFAEHLGRDIYGGLWVGENSPIPNTRGVRNDIVAALKRLNIPVVRWPG
ncbi:MAG TPA: hypothetical protein VEV81_06475, partial [Pyrinomonadaceae bacterium]|nr:hypothetical protein [Pyrinomonadaceae bacterium]